MKTFVDFIKSVLVGGVFVILPVGLLAMLAAKVVQTLEGSLEPIVHQLPPQLHFPTLIASAILLLTCFFVGLVARTGVGKYMGNHFERTILNRIPGYSLVRSIVRRLKNADGDDTFAPAFVEVEEALVPAFVVEEHVDGRFTVFVPSAPTPAIGAVYIMAKERVHIIDAPFIKAVTCISNWGAGSAELLKTIRVRKQLAS